MKRIIIYLTYLFFSFPFSGYAQFTPGNIVVCRIGDGTTALSVNASPVFLDEYSTNGTLVRTIPLPTVTNGNNRALTLCATSITSANHSGMIMRSVDGQYLTVAGYNAPVGFSSVSRTTSTLVQRVVGLIKYDDVLNTSTALTNWSSGQSVVTASTTDGTEFWLASTGGGAGTGGTRYAVLGATTSVQVNSTSNFVYSLGIYQNQLYNCNSAVLNKVGTGLPKISGTTLTDFGSLPTAGAFRHQFVLLDLDPTIQGVDVLYFADEAQGLSKFSLVNGVWSLNGYVGGDADDYRGLTASVHGGIVTLFATRIGANSATFGGGELVKLTDPTGYNGNFSGTPTVLATTVTNNASFRGVALAPEQAPSCASTSFTFTVSPTSAVFTWNDLPGVVGYEYALTTSSTPPASGTATTGTSHTATGLTQGQTYYFHLRTDCGNFNRSAWTTLSFIPSCVAPSQPTVSNIVYTADVKWNMVYGPSGYEYAVTTSSTPPSFGTATTDTSFVATGLASVTQYYVHVRSNCGTGGFSPWTTKAFATSCLNPIVTATANEDTRQFKWSTVNGTTGYEYALTTYRHPPVGGTHTEDTTVQFSRLNTGTTYYFHVRTECAKNGSASPWTTLPFQTTGLDAYPNPAGNTLSIRLYGITGTGDVLISDAMGRVVKRVLMTNSSVEVPVVDLAPGVYLVRYSDGENKYTVKVLKK